MNETEDMTATWEALKELLLQFPEPPTTPIAPLLSPCSSNQEENEEEAVHAPSSRRSVTLPPCPAPLPTPKKTPPTSGSCIVTSSLSAAKVSFSPSSPSPSDKPLHPPPPSSVRSNKKSASPSNNEDQPQQQGEEIPPPLPDRSDPPSSSNSSNHDKAPKVPSSSIIQKREILMQALMKQPMFAANATLRPSPSSLSASNIPTITTSHVARPVPSFSSSAESVPTTAGRARDDSGIPPRPNSMMTVGSGSQIELPTGGYQTVRETRKKRNSFSSLNSMIIVQDGKEIEESEEPPALHKETLLRFVFSLFLACFPLTICSFSAFRAVSVTGLDSIVEERKLYRALLSLGKEEVVSKLETAYQQRDSLAIPAPSSSPSSSSSHGHHSPKSASKRTKGAFKKSLYLLKPPSDPIPQAKVLHHYINFYDEGKEETLTEAPLEKELRGTITISNTGGVKLPFAVEPPPKKSCCSFTFLPSSGVLKRKETKEIEVMMKVHSPVLIEEVIPIRMDGLGRFFLLISLPCEKSVFGVLPEDLPQTNDEGLTVPTVLVQMKDYLLANGGLKQEGIFRLAPDEIETLKCKKQLNQEGGAFLSSSSVDINIIANLIKVWFRELPEQLLNDISAEQFAKLDDCEDFSVGSWQLLQTAVEPSKRNLIMWLLRLLARFAEEEKATKMSARNLAIVVAPNLFCLDDRNPMESLHLSQKVVNFFFTILSRVSEEQKKSK
ncbi:Rho GTPase-activating protein gacA, variant 2 [Balamuthia mandrillaris]